MTERTDRFGNPITPRGATGAMSSYSVFGRDPNRPGFDSTGYMQALIAKMPRLARGSSP